MIILFLSDNRPNDKNDGDNVKVKSDSTISQRNLKEFDEIQSSSNYSTNLINEGIIAGQRIAKISVITLISIGIVELITGFVSGSVVATADGIDSISDAMISFIVLLGLRLAHRPPDNSYQSLVNPHEIKQPVLAIVVLAAASAISLQSISNEDNCK